MTSGEKLKVITRYWLEGREMIDALRAMQFAESVHTKLRRDGVTPEFHHQISIVAFLKTLHTSMQKPEETIVAAFLHDLTEDYPHKGTVDAFKEVFPDPVKAESYYRYANTLNKKIYDSQEAYFQALSQSPVCSLVKGADRVHNFQTMAGVFSPEKQLEYIFECREYIIPMLKKASKRFPEQADAYYNILHTLYTQIELIEIINKQVSHPSHS